jgi:L-rhamnose mutarotase
MRARVRPPGADPPSNRRSLLCDRRTLARRSACDTCAVEVEGRSRRERVCFLLRVRADRLAEYRERHAAVWPDMLQALRETGWSNYSLFVREDGLLVGYLETDDLESALAGMQAREVNARWQAEMAPFFELPEGGRPDTGFERLDEIFHLA